jgi:dolichol kinase
MIHISTIGIPIGYLFFGKRCILWIVGVAVGVALFIECSRFIWSDFAHLFNKLTGVLLRKHEKSDLTGATYLLIGSFISIFLYEQFIAIAVLFIVILADSLSALSGKLFGSHMIYHRKSIEGCIVFIFISTIIILLVPVAPIWIGLIGVVTAFIVDIAIRKIDDNLTIPVFAGGTMQILWMIHHSA